MRNPLASPDDYALFIHQLPEEYVAVRYSSLVYVPLGIKAGKVKGLVAFSGNVILCVQEFLNFELQVIEGYGYEVSKISSPAETVPPAEEYCRPSYQKKEKLWWYDSFPHPNDRSLASTHPHHKHVHPNIKHNRIVAPELTFIAENLTCLVTEIIHFLARNNT
jgi:hypothetical protein